MSPLQSLHEIETAEAKTRERAWRFDQYTDQKARAINTIARLDREQRPDDTVARQMLAQVELLPVDLVTSGNRVIAGGLNMRDTLRANLTDAINQIAIKRRKFDEKLARAQKDLKDADDALALLAAD